LCIYACILTVGPSERISIIMLGLSPGDKVMVTEKAKGSTTGQGADEQAQSFDINTRSKKPSQTVRAVRLHFLAPHGPAPYQYIT